MTHDWHTLCAGIRCAGEVLPMAAVACVMALDEYMQWCTIISQTQTADHGVSQSFRNVFFFSLFALPWKKTKLKDLNLDQIFCHRLDKLTDRCFYQVAILMAGFEHFDWFLGQYKPQTWPKKSRDSSLTWKRFVFILFLFFGKQHDNSCWFLSKKRRKQVLVTKKTCQAAQWFWQSCSLLGMDKLSVAC